MFMAIGVYTIVMSGLAYAYPPLRNLETDLPDAAGLPSRDAAEVASAMEAVPEHPAS